MKTIMRFLIVSSLLITQISIAQWVQTNGPYGGNVKCFAVSGTNLFAGTGEGVFLSTNNGTNWTQTSLDSMGINALAVSGTNLFAGADGGVFLSTNNGTSWVAINTGLVTHHSVLSLVVMGKNLIAGTGGFGVFLSTNIGTSWSQTSLDSMTIQAITVSGTNLLAGGWKRYVYPEIPSVYSVYLSIDSGTTWTAINTGFSNTRVSAFAVSGTNLFAGAAGGGVFLSRFCNAVDTPPRPTERLSRSGGSAPLSQPTDLPPRGDVWFTICETPRTKL